MTRRLVLKTRATLLHRDNGIVGQFEDRYLVTRCPRSFVPGDWANESHMGAQRLRQVEANDVLTLILAPVHPGKLLVHCLEAKVRL